MTHGTIIEASFFGNTQRYVIRLDGAETLIATRPSLGEPMLPPGETIESLLWKLTDEGARKRYTPYHEKARAQIEREP